MDIPDEDLVRLARDGDPAAFRLLVERHLPMARARAARLCPQPDDADDAVQDAFLQAFIALDRLHKARRRLREYITAHRPDLIPATSRRTPMTAVRIAHADPWPERTPDGRMEISHVLVILADDAGHRALPVRLRVPHDKLWRLLSRPDDLNEEDLLDDDHAEEATGRLLQAAGVTNAVRSRAFWGTPLPSSTIQVV